MQETTKLISSVNAMIKKYDQFAQTPEEKLKYEKRTIAYYELVVPLLMCRLEESEAIIADLRDQIGLLLPCVDGHKLLCNTEAPSAALAASPGTI